MRFESTGSAEYTIEDFKTSMDAPASLSDFAQVKRRIIDPAVKELSQKDGWIINWHTIKAGYRLACIFNLNVTLKDDYYEKNAPSNTS